MLPCIARSSKPLQPHQKAAVKAFIYSGIKYSLIWHATGTGKSLTAAAAAKCFLDMHPIGHVILITMASLIAGFTAELVAYEKKLDMSKFSMYTYQGFTQAMERGEIDTCNGALVIIDEVHNLRSVEGKMYAAVHKCTSTATKILAMTATPMVNSETDILAIMTLISGGPIIDKHLAAQILDNEKLSRALFGCAVSIYKPNAATLAANFPKAEEHFVPIVMTPPTLRAYTDVEKDRRSKALVNLFHLSSEDDTDLSSFYSGARMISASAPEKISWATDFIWHVINNKPSARHGLTRAVLDSHAPRIICYSHFKEHGGHLLIAALKARNITHAAIDGEVPKEKRRRLVDSYVAGKIPVILITQAGSTGLNLKATGYTLILDPCWTIAEEEQVKARGVRFLSHTSLPPKKRRVLILKLLLIKPADQRDFAALINGKKRYEDASTPVAIEIKITVDAHRKQESINARIKMLESKIPTVEDCAARKITIESLGELRTYRRAGHKIATAAPARASGTYAAPGRIVVPKDDRISLNDAMLRDIIVGSGAIRFTAPTAVLFAGSTDIVIASFVAANKHIVPHVADIAAPTKRYRLGIINWGLNFATGIHASFPQRPDNFLRAVAAVCDSLILLVPTSRAASIKDTLARPTKEARYESKFDLIVSKEADSLTVLAI